jgi:hypothetical protein caurA7_06963
MPGFLIQYHRLSGRVTCTRFDTLRDALLERLRLDSVRTDPNIENVAISAESEESLRCTHARYFFRENQAA